MVHSAARRPGDRRRLAVALAASAARAADAPDVTIERMRLSSDRTGILSVESGQVLPHLGLAGARGWGTRTTSWCCTGCRTVRGWARWCTTGGAGRCPRRWGSSTGRS